MLFIENAVLCLIIFTASSQASSRPSSRASSRAQSIGSDISELSDTADVFTTMQTETTRAGGRTTTTVSYKTHQTKTHSVPSSTTSRSYGSSGVGGRSVTGRSTTSRLPQPTTRRGASGTSTPATPRSGTETPKRY